MHDSRVGSQDEAQPSFEEGSGWAHETHRGQAWPLLRLRHRRRVCR